MKKFIAAALITAAVMASPIENPVKVELLNPSRAFRRDLPATLTFAIARLLITPPQDNLSLRVECGPWHSTTDVPDKARLTDKEVKVEFNPAYLKSGRYELKAQLCEGDKVLTSGSWPVEIVKPLSSERMECWYWPSTVAYRAMELDFDWAKQELDAMAELGITMFQIDLLWVLKNPEKAGKIVDYGLSRGVEIGLRQGSANTFNVDGLPPIDVLEPGKKRLIADPWSPRMQERARIMSYRGAEFAAGFQGMTSVFMHSEVEDRLALSRNPEIISKHEQALGFPVKDKRKLSRKVLRVPPGTAKYTSEGVISDEDLNYRYAVYFYRLGDGFPVINRIFSETGKKLKPSLRYITDPLRNTSISGRFAGVDVVSTWTYTNPDPKYMLHVEALLAQARPEKKDVFHTITLWNYGGALAPLKSPNRATAENVMAMGPDRLKECAWLNLSRGIDGIGFYVSTLMDFIIPDLDPNNVPRESFSAIKDLSDQVLKPYGAFIRQLENTPRKAAVLSSMASHVYSTAPSFARFYPAYDPIEMLILLNMIHIPADIIYEEDILNGQLDRYDLLVLPHCETLPESVYRKICDFSAGAGKTVLGDQYLRANIPGARKVNFDFAYRKGVHAETIMKGELVEDNDDTQGKKVWKTRKSRGTTAAEDRDIMEDYAKLLTRELAAFDSGCSCDTPRILLNRLSGGGGEYLALVNDNRTYDERVGKYKSILSKGVKQTGNIRWSGLPRAATIYDAFTGREIAVADDSGTAHFAIELLPSSGAFLTCQPKEPGKLAITAPAEVRCGADLNVEISLPEAVGILPLSVELRDGDGLLHDYSGPKLLKNGKCRLNLPIACNAAPGNYILTANWGGNRCRTEITVKEGKSK